MEFGCTTDCNQHFLTLNKLIKNIKNIDITKCNNPPGLCIQPDIIISSRNPRLQFKSNKMNITEKNTKAEIVSASCEIIDSQADTIHQLQERQLVLWSLVGVMAALLAFGA